MYKRIYIYIRICIEIDMAEKTHHAVCLLKQPIQKSCGFAASGTPAHENSRSLRGGLHIHTYIYIQTHARVYIYTHKLVYIYIIYVNTYIWIPACMFMYIYMYICIEYQEHDAACGVMKNGNGACAA